MSTANPQDYRCPLCNQVDRVEKVSALVAGGTSAKASQLLPPEKPIQASIGGCFIVALVAMFLLGAYLLIVGVIPGLIGIINGTFQTTPGWFILGMLIEIILLGIPSIFLILGVLNAPAKRREYENRLHEWERAMRKWSELYYCSRNDVVFIPGLPSAVLDASEMWTFCVSLSNTLTTSKS